MYISNGFHPIFSRPPTILCNFSPISTTQLRINRTPISCSSSSSSSSSIPARDRVVDFGKHRGTMLGALPSKYLKWVSQNLRARDFEEWAKLADEVLEDPVYRDRIEWEFAESVLTGDNGSADSRSSSVDALLEFSQRFGWDNDDKLGWSRVDFSLLGTSKGRRIPRKGVARVEDDQALSQNLYKKKKMKSKLGVLGEGGEDSVGRGKREERIQRQRLRRGVKIDDLEEKHGVEAQKQEEEMVSKAAWNPFPGREALLKKVMDGRRVL